MHASAHINGQNRAVVTLAAGSPLYWEMAINLARSFLYWNKGKGIRFYIITDLSYQLPASLAGIDLVRVDSKRLGIGFSCKLQLDLISPAAYTLFIDADCLIFGNLDSVFRAFYGNAISVVGDTISNGEWFGDVRSVLERLNLLKMPKFNGGLYYFEKGVLSKGVYTKARELETRYDELGLVRLRGRPNDELLIALSMAEHGLTAILDDGSIMADPYAYPGAMSLDILRGRAVLKNPAPPNPVCRPWNLRRVAEPVIVHFLGDANRLPEYRAEVMALRLIQRGILPFGAFILSRLGVLWPGIIARTLKSLLRPVYHRFFGIRPVQKSERIV